MIVKIIFGLVTVITIILSLYTINKLSCVKRKAIFFVMDIVCLCIYAVSVYLRGNISIYNIIILMQIGVLSTIVVSDIENMMIPNILLILLNSLGLCASLFIPEYFFLKSILGAAVVTGFCYLISVKSKSSMGMGDVYSLCGLMLTLKFSSVMNFMFLTLFCALVYSIVMLILKKKTTKTEIPFAPFMMIGYLAAVVF